TLLPHITNSLRNFEHQHGFKTHHFTNSALYNITNTIANCQIKSDQNQIKIKIKSNQIKSIAKSPLPNTRGANENQPPSRTILVSLDLSKNFDIVETFTLHLHTKLSHPQEKFSAHQPNHHQIYQQL